MGESNYQAQFKRYLATVKNNVGGDLHNPRRVEHHFECLKDWSLFHDLDSVKTWFQEKRDSSSMNIEVIPLRTTRKWLLDEATGDICHESGEFFTIHGLRISNSGDREVGSEGWDQPILTQAGYDGGILGLLSKRFEGIPHYLIEAKAEPGNYEKLQLSPTLQATFSNLKRAHAGRKPHFSEYFENPDDNEVTVLYKQWLSEDGGRLYLKRNLGMLVELDDSIELDIPDSFIWLSMFQIKELLNENAWINPHIRGIIAHL